MMVSMSLYCPFFGCAALKVKKRLVLIQQRKLYSHSQHPKSERKEKKALEEKALVYIIVSNDELKE